MRGEFWSNKWPTFSFFLLLVSTNPPQNLLGGIVCVYVCA
jgi:hypothetical protein